MSKVRKKKLHITPSIMIRILADAAMVNIALVVAVAVRLLVTVSFQNPPDVSQIIQRDVAGFLQACIPLTVISLIVFALNGFYTYSKHYQSKYKVLVVLQAVSLSFLLFGFFAYFTSGGSLPMARAALPLAWLLAAGLLIGGRIWSEVWKRMVVPETESMMRAQAANKRVLVIGGAGYIGTALVPQLLKDGFRVRLLDILLFGHEPMREFADHPQLELIQGDFRNVQSVMEAMVHVDSVVHLGGIVGDPACSLDEDLTIDVNLLSTRMIAELARMAGVQRFVFASTCSVYGACDDLLDERSDAQPVSLYGHTKRASEDLLQRMADDRFSPTILRFATIYGLSGRTRFDLVINLLTAKAKLDGHITVHGGDQWRPFVHVQDAATAIVNVLEAPRELIANQVFNVGSNEQNYTIREVAEMIHQCVHDAEMQICEDNRDHRNYRVSFNKIHHQLGFTPTWSVPDGIQQVLEAIAAGAITDYSEARFSNEKFLTEEGTTKLARDHWARQLIDDLTSK